MQLAVVVDRHIVLIQHLLHLVLLILPILGLVGCHALVLLGHADLVLLMYGLGPDRVAALPSVAAAWGLVGRVRIRLLR